MLTSVSSAKCHFSSQNWLHSVNNKLLHHCDWCLLQYQLQRVICQVKLIPLPQHLFFLSRYRHYLHHKHWSEMTNNTQWKEWDIITYIILAVFVWILHTTKVRCWFHCGSTKIFVLIPIKIDCILPTINSCTTVIDVDFSIVCKVSFVKSNWLHCLNIYFSASSWALSTSQALIWNDNNIQ